MYAHTAYADDTEIAENYEYMHSALNDCKNNEWLICFGDLNANVADKKSAPAN